MYYISGPELAVIQTVQEGMNATMTWKVQDEDPTNLISIYTPNNDRVIRIVYGIVHNTDPRFLPIGDVTNSIGFLMVNVSRLFAGTYYLKSRENLVSRTLFVFGKCLLILQTRFVHMSL